jgi:hypothetical protein
MNRTRLEAFARLTARQQAGDAAAVDSIRALQPELDDGYCLWNLFQEWSDAFSFEPGRTEAIGPIARIAAGIVSFETDDTLAMVHMPEWGELVAMRGPCEGIVDAQCDSCGTRYPLFRMSGFIDAEALICRACGDVYFKSTYDDDAAPPCDCGGAYARGCPKCGSRSHTITSRETSRYEYFSKHRFVRGPSV